MKKIIAKFLEIKSLAHQKNQVLTFWLMIAALVSFFICFNFIIIGIFTGTLEKTEMFWRPLMFIQGGSAIAAIIVCLKRNKGY